MSHDDLAAVAALLDIPEPDLRNALGGGWHAAEGTSDNPTWVGHQGPAVALTVSDTHVTVGLACGEWSPTGTMLWAAEEPRTTLPRTMPKDALLRALEDGTESAADVARANMITCHFCQRIVALEYAFNENACYRCITGQK